MANGFSFPGVGDVDQSVTGLDTGGIRVFAFGSLECQDGIPLLPVFRDSDIQHVPFGWEGSAAHRMVVNEQLATINQGRRIGSGVGVGKVSCRDGRPGFTFVFRPALRQ